MTIRRFEGYHEEHALPIKPGDVVTIRKGTITKAVGRPARPAGRTYKVKVHHVLGGMERGDRKTNPVVVWAGTGGYWTEADINDIPEALK